MKKKILQIIETLKEGTEITILLRDGQRIYGRYAGNDNNEQIMLTPQNSDSPLLGWEIENVEDIVCKDVEPAGDIVKVEIVDIKTNRKAVMSVDFSGEQGSLEVDFIPTISCDENGLYTQIAAMFMDLLINRSNH